MFRDGESDGTQWREGCGQMRGKNNNLDIKNRIRSTERNHRADFSNHEKECNKIRFIDLCLEIFSN